MSQITTRHIDANGQTFAIDEIGEGDDIALFLHGFPESRFSWRHQLPLLAGLGWRAVAPDMRGYGDSSRPKARSAYRLDHLTADVAALFDALGARRRLLIAHDWGALVAWAFAIDKLRALDGLVIMNVPHPSVYQRALRRSLAQWLKSWYVLFFQIPGLPEVILTANGAHAIGEAFSRMAVDKSRFPPEVLEVYRRNALMPGAMTAMLNYYRANISTMGGYGRGAVPTIEIPTLMIWGEQDTALGIELTEGYDRHVRDLTLHRLPGVSHWVQQEAPEAVNGLLSSWIVALAR